MKSFRVVNAKFRILKGGKIGLSLSISLVVSSLIFSTTKANAVDYFTDVQVSTGTATNTTGLYDVTVQTATNTGTFDLSRLSTTYDSVVFKPVSWVSSSYGTPSFVGNFDSNSDSINDGSTYSLNATSSTDKLTLTFNTNANAGSISKDNTTVYSAPITTNVDIYANSTYNLTTSTSTAYTANLIFQGSNNISGATNIGDGNIKLNGGVTFGGTVNAGSISVDTTNTIIFNSNVDLTAGTTDAMNFSVNGKVLLNEDFTGNITSSGDNLGTVTIVGNGTGKEQIITGNIGTSTSSDIGILYIGSDTIDSNYSRTVIYGDVYANSTVLNNNGTTNSSTLVLANGSDITSTITTADTNMGILTLQGSSTVTGTVGSTGKLAEVNSGATGSNSTFTGTVNSVNVTNTGTGTTIFQDDVNATNVNVNAGTSTFQDNLIATTTTITTGTGNFNTTSTSLTPYTTTSNIVFGGDGTANLYNGLTGNVTTSGAGTGTLNLVGSNNQTVNGNVGVGNALKDVNSGVNGTTSTFIGTVNSVNVTNTGTGITIFQDDVNATNVNVNAGTSTFQDNLIATTTTITTGTGNFNTTSTSLTPYTTTSNIVFGGDGTANLYNGLTGNVTTSGAGTGTLNLVGSNNQTVNGNVGVGNALKDVNSGVNGTTSTFIGTVNSVNVTNTGTGITIFQDDVNATNVNVNAGTSTFQDNLIATTTTITTGTGNFNTTSTSLTPYTTTSNIVFGGDGTANLYNGLTGNVTTSGAGTGTLNLVGSNNQTVNGNVGVGNALKDVNSGVNGTTSTFIGTVNSVNVTNTGTGITIFQDDVNATNVNVNSGTTNFEKNLIASTITIGTGIGNFNTVSGTTSSNIVFSSTGTANLNNGLNGAINFAGNDGIVNVSDGKGISGTITTTTNNTGILNYLGDGTISSTVGSSGLGIKELNINTNDLQDTTTGVLASGNIYAGIIKLQNDGELTLANGVNIQDTDLSNPAITTTTTNTGTLTLQGASIISGDVGDTNYSLKEINSGITGTTSTFNDKVYAQTINNTGTNTTGISTFKDDVTATNVNVNSGTTNFEKNLIASTITIGTGIGNFNTVSGTTSSNIVFSSTGTANLNNGLNGAINFAGNDGIVNVSDGKGISGTITTTTNNTGILNYLGDGTISSTVGSSGLGIKELNINTNDLQDTTTGVLASGNIYAGIIKLQNDGELTLANGVNIQDTDLSNPAITTTTTNTGTLTLQGASIISGDVGDTNYSLKEINSGITGTTSTFNDKVYAQTINNTGTNTTGISTFKDDVTATNVNVNSGTTNFEKNLIASTITIGTGIGNFNTVSGTTSSNIVFSSTGTANLNNGLTGNINFANYDATVNVSDGKGILGSVETLANNTGILNFKGDGTISGNIGGEDIINNLLYGIKELNINSENEQDSSDGVRVTYSALGREIYADTITLRNNATFTLSDGVNLIDTGSDNIIVKVDTNDKGILTFEGTSTIDGEVGESNRVINTINAGAVIDGVETTVTFNDMVYATNLKYSDNGKVILNGDNGSNVEGMKGTVDFGVATVSKPTLGNGKLEIGDNVNLTTGTSGIQFANANNAILTFNGTSTIYGVLGGNTAGNSTFESIYAGVTAETVTFKNDVYVKESTFHVSEDGVVNFEGNLYGDLVFENDGTVNVANTKSIIVSSTPLAITTANNGQGTINFEGTTTLYTDIGEDLFRLKEVNFGTVGTASNSYTQNINKDIYANDITIGNSSNKTTANLTSDMTFYGNLNLSSNSVLDVNNNDITVEDEIVLASNSTLKFEIDTSDLIAGQAVANDTSGSIDANSLNIQDDIKVHIDYNGTLAGKYEYSLIDANSSTGTYTEGTEANGKVSDNSIIDSKVILKDNNLVLVADRTNNGSFNPEDLYIEKSEIGEDYSNAASQALADYANGVDRAGALAQIINELEYLEGGTVLSEAKKQEMIETQRKLAPIANSSNMQTSITASNLAMTTIKGRLSDIRTGEMNNFTPTLYRTGLSSGDYYSFDTSFWLKGMAGKATQDQVDEYYGFDTSTYGFVGGMDKISGDGTIFGAALAYSTTKTNQENAASDSSDTTSIQGTIYSSLAYENAYVDSYLSYAKHKTDGTRTANSGKLTSSVDAEQISAKVETGYTIPVNDGVSLTPFASLEYSLLNQKGYTEKGTAYQNDALKVDSLKLNRGTVELGTKLTSNIELEETLIIPQLSVSAYNSFGDNSADIKAQYIGGGKEFVTPVSELNKTMYNVGLGLETKISDSTSVIFDMDYDRSKDGKFQGYSGSVTFGISF